MPISNLAKIFGPTILGYSSLEPDQHAIFTETMIQANVSAPQVEFFELIRLIECICCQVMQHLLDIPTDYWAGFINVDTTDTQSSEADKEFNKTRNYFGELKI